MNRVKAILIVVAILYGCGNDVPKFSYTELCYEDVLFYLCQDADPIRSIGIRYFYYCHEHDKVWSDMQEKWVNPSRFHRSRIERYLVEHK